MDIISSPATLSGAPFGGVNETHPHSGMSPFISFNTYKIILIVISYVLTLGVAGFGVFSNTANVVVYIKMGLRETTNISFFALAIIDWLVSTISFPYVGSSISDIAPIGQEMLFLSQRYLPAIMLPCLACGAWITAVLSAERCLCIVMPLKVKTVVTRGRIIGLIASLTGYEAVLSVLMMVNSGPPYFRPNPTRLLLLVCSVSIPVLLCFISVLFCSVFMVTRLRQSLTWRTSTSSQPGKTSGVRERKVLVAVLWICVMFLICYAPTVLMLSFVAAIAYPRFSIFDPYYGWLSRSVFAFNYLLQTVSSSSNIFIYYKVSTRYREVFKESFCSHTTRLQ